jgi:hypothetical protein
VPPVFLVELRIGFTHQGVVARILPAGAVVAVVAQEQIEKRVRVFVVADPTAHGHVEIDARLFVEKHLPLDLLNLHAECRVLSATSPEFDGGLDGLHRVGVR